MTHSTRDIRIESMGPKSKLTGRPIQGILQIVHFRSNGAQKVEMETKRILRMTRTVIFFMTVTIMFCLIPPGLSAASSDEVIFKSGQKLIGEIKGLDKGILKFKTDETGTVSVKWVKVSGLSSPNRFRVEAGTGLIFIGSIEKASEENKTVIVTDTGKILLGLDLIVTITSFEKRLLDRFKGYLDVGFSLQRAQRQTTFLLGTNVSYRTSKWNLVLNASSYLSKQETVPRTTRNDVGLSAQRDMKKRWVAVAMTGFQQNAELGLDRRLSLGGGLGHKLIWTNNMIFTVAAGAIGIDEKYSDAAASAQSAEAIFSGSLSAFRYTFPKLNFLVSAKIYPSLTDWGRVRAELDTSLSYELISDFTISLSGFYTLDSRPPTEGARKHDYGFTTSIRWEFHQ